MLKSTFAASVLAVTLSASAANAVVVFSENFDSYINGDLSGQGGWTVTGTPPATPNPIQVAGDADKYAQLTTGQDEYKAFTSIVPHDDGLTLTTSLNANVTTASSFGDYFSHLSSPAGTTTNFYQRLYARSAESGFQLGLVDISGTGTAITWGTDVLAFGTDHDIEVDWNFVSGANNDTFAVRVNDNPYLSHSWTSATLEPTTLESANLRQGSISNAPTVQVDNYVIEVIPEPTGLALMGLAALGITRRRR